VLTEQAPATTRLSPAALLLRRKDLIAVLALAAVIVLGLTFRAGALDLPLDRDEGAYGYIGANLTSGLVPYRDAFDHKPPGIYVFYAFASLGPDKTTSVRLASDVLFAVSLLLVYAIAARAYGRTAGLAAAVAHASLGNSFHLEAARANTEQVMVPLLLLGLWSFQKGVTGRTVPWFLLSGLAGSAAVLMKQVGALPALVLLAFLVLGAVAQRDWRRSAAEIGALAAGAALPALATLVYFGAAGALDDLWFAVVDYNSDYVRSYWEAGAARLNNFDPIQSPWTYVAMGFIFSFPFVGSRDRGWDVLLAAWAFANLVGAKAGLRDFPHYFVPAIPGIAILAGAYISWVSERAAALVRGAPWLRPALAAAAALGLFAWQADGYVEFYFSSTPTEKAAVEFGAHGEQIFAPSEEVASYVRAATGPEDEILVWADEAQIYFLSERRAASRYIYTYPFVFIPEGPATIQSDLLERRPKVVVTYAEDSPLRVGLAELLAGEGYVQTFQAGWLVVYERR
jgi:4-amino-4-deoxy-L-arabinose transferase-like glycosyltransferase